MRDRALPALALSLLLLAGCSGGGESDTATAAESQTPETFVMPDVVGMNLQEAQELLQSHGSYLMDQEDASGRRRPQLRDSNWQVCAQVPEPGVESPTTVMVELSAVKLGETCL
ncbi:PASTA domain-containing protein [Cellulomonas sp. NPDC089187]|uniref:PASTA domain-containing protein n=1 Tax=Cellulomonas sp. NPDC089187 TaxID=3154970 RepID=UPI0034277003